jgi:hypothetical protein
VIVIAGQHAVASRFFAIGPILAIGLMATGMISAAVSGRFWIGVLLANLAGVGLVLFALSLSLPVGAHPFSIALVFVIASLSFAARGALFARSAESKGWWIGSFVVAGEAAVVLTALAAPGAWPGWILALLPAQWATMAIQTSLAGSGAWTASSTLIALGGTAMATMLVWWLWPQRWTYAIMFSVWLCLSALVYHSPALPLQYAEPFITDSKSTEVLHLSG